MFESLIERNKVFASFFLISIFGFVGIGLFFWMAGTGWQDRTGVIVGIIFIVLSVIQVLFSIFWYRAAKKDACSTEESNGKELQDLTRSPKKDAESKGPRESSAPLLRNRESARDSSADACDVQVKMKEEMKPVSESLA